MAPLAPKTRAEVSWRQVSDPGTTSTAILTQATTSLVRKIWKTQVPKKARTKAPAKTRIRTTLIHSQAPNEKVSLTSTQRAMLTLQKGPLDTTLGKQMKMPKMAMKKTMAESR